MAKIETIHERIRLLVEQLAGGKNTVFAQNLGISESNVRGYIKNVVPKADVLSKIVTTYDVISPSWLLTGEGPMLQNSASDALSVSSSSSDKESLTLSDNTSPVLMQNGPGSHNNHQKVIGADGTCSGREMAMQATIELQKKMIEDRDNEIAFLRDMLRKGLE